MQQGAGGCASVEAQRLSFLTGEWKVTSRFRLSREPEKWEETQVRSTIRYLFENCLLVEQFEGTRQGHPFRVTAMYAHNRTSKKYEWVGADSEHGVLTLYTGSLSGNDLVLESMVEISGQSILLRRVLTKNPAGGFEIRYHRSSGGVGNRLVLGLFTMASSPHRRLTSLDASGISGLVIHNLSVTRLSPAASTQPLGRLFGGTASHNVKANTIAGEVENEESQAHTLSCRWSIDHFG